VKLQQPAAGRFHAGYCIHTRPYRETSVLVDYWSEDLGFVTLVCRGVRKISGRSMTRGLLQPFVPLWVDWFGQAELVTLNSVEIRSTPVILNPKALVWGLYANELLYQLCRFPQRIPHSTLFIAYEELLHLLTQPVINELILRRFELALLEALGYGIRWCALDGQRFYPDLYYEYILNTGFVVSSRTDVFLGLDLLAMSAGDWKTTSVALGLKQLLRLVLSFHLNGKTLHSRFLYRQDLQHADTTQ
jgi:DNA repair protein RecO (recombination protein O)